MNHRRSGERTCTEVTYAPHWGKQRLSCRGFMGRIAETIWRTCQPTNNTVTYSRPPNQRHVETKTHTPAPPHKSHAISPTPSSPLVAIAFATRHPTTSAPQSIAILPGCHRVTSFAVSLRSLF